MLQKGEGAMPYMIITQEPRGVISRKASRHDDLLGALEEARRKSQLSYVEKAAIREIYHDGKLGPTLAQFAKGNPLS